MGWEFADAGDHHSVANVEKMRNGIPITDADRRPWLETLRRVIADWLAIGSNGVLACSALKAIYRKYLRTDKDVRFVYLKTSPDVLSQRLLERRDHYMKQTMLESQMATLEEPKNELTVDADKTPEQIVQEIGTAFQLL
jgi:gluconokinase